MNKRTLLCMYKRNHEKECYIAVLFVISENFKHMSVERKIEKIVSLSYKEMQ